MRWVVILAAAGLVACAGERDASDTGTNAVSDHGAGPSADTSGSADAARDAGATVADAGRSETGLARDSGAKRDGGVRRDSSVRRDSAPARDSKPPDPNFTPDGCFKWAGASKNGALQAAVDKHACVEVQAGTFVLDKAVRLRPGKRLRGLGSARSTLRADRARWTLSCCDSVIADTLPSNPATNPFSVSRLTIDGANVATYGVCCRGYVAADLVITATRCSAIGIAGKGVVVRKCELRDTAWPTAVPGRGTISCATGGFGGVAEGAAIYSESDGARLDPLIEDNRIVNSNGPGLDINGTWGGIFRRNTVEKNTAWAAVSLYGASHWTIADNVIRHPNNQPPQPYHPYCATGPAGGRSAAIFICQDTDTKGRVSNYNTVVRNKASSYYGILSVGADELKAYWAPRLNTFRDNDVFGSTYGCADDFKPGQWFSDDNVWTGNNCGGTPNSGPGYF